jgi:regulation of enolase protein 1 (concanavalin A-like superfamily)
MLRCAFVLVAFSPILAAPVPKAEQFTVKGWGDPVDPLKDCTFDVGKDGKLTLTVPGKGRDLAAHRDEMHAPRVLREVEGDFKIEVSVDGEWPLGATSTLMSRPPFFGAGIFLAEDDKNYIRFEKAQYESGGQKPCYASLELWQDGQWSKSGTPEDGELDRAKIAHLRLTRKGEAITAAFSQDGKTWNEIKPLEAKFGAKLKIGVCALHTTDTAFKPVFSDLKIEKLGETAKP